MSNYSDPKPCHKIAPQSDTVDFVDPCHCLKALTAGTLAVVDQNDVEVIYTVAVGELINIRAKRINSTGSSATAAQWWE